MSSRIRNAAVILLATLAFGWPSLYFPFGRDQGNYAYAAWVWREGAVPYRDVYVFKPPGTLWIHALAQEMFGPSMTAIRALDLGWTALSALALAAVMGRLGSSRGTALLAGTLYPFLFYQMSYWTTSQTDGWMALPVLLAILAAAAGAEAPTLARRCLLWAGAGVALGLAAVLKYTALAGVLPIAVWLGTRRPWREAPAAVVSLVGGVAVPLALTAAWLVAIDAWDAFLDCQAGILPTYVATTRKHTLGVALLKVMTTYTDNTRFMVGGMLLIVGLVVLATRALRGHDRARAATLVAWWLAGLASCLSQGKLFKYHYLLMFAPAAAIAAEGLTGTLSLLRARLGRHIGMVGAAIAALAILGYSSFPGIHGNATPILLGKRTIDQEWRRKGAYRSEDFSLADDLALADWLVANTDSDDRAFLWGFEPLVNYVARRKTVSRFLYNYPFAVNWGNPRDETDLLEALRAHPPEVFVVSSNDATPAVTGNSADSRELFEAFEALHAFVQENYGPSIPIRRFDVYRRLR